MASETPWRRCGRCATEVVTPVDTCPVCGSSELQAPPGTDAHYPGLPDAKPRATNLLLPELDADEVGIVRAWLLAYKLRAQLDLPNREGVVLRVMLPQLPEPLTAKLCELVLEWTDD